MVMGSVVLAIGVVVEREEENSIGRIAFACFCFFFLFAFLCYWVVCVLFSFWKREREMEKCSLADV